MQMKYWDNIPLILLTNIGQRYWWNIVEARRSQYWANIVPNIYPILYNMFYQYWSNIIANIGPRLANNIGGILSKREVAILGQYCTQYLPNIVRHILPILVQYYGQYWPKIGHQYRWNIGEARSSQYWANIVQRVLPISVQYLWPTLAQYWSTILANIVVV